MLFSQKKYFSIKNSQKDVFLPFYKKQHGKETDDRHP